MITAYIDAENHGNAMSMGADDFIMKPIDFTQLQEKLKL
jgi:DNA-binding response OmpR family regulator